MKIRRRDNHYIYLVVVHSSKVLAGVEITGRIWNYGSRVVDCLFQNAVLMASLNSVDEWMVVLDHNNNHRRD
jgi:hypothetical protein